MRQGDRYSILPFSPPPSLGPAAKSWGQVGVPELLESPVARPGMGCLGDHQRFGGNPFGGAACRWRLLTKEGRTLGEVA